MSSAVSSTVSKGTVRPVGPLVALLPAHDEEASIGAALDSLRDQTRPPDHIIVVADNCTDRTVEIARERGVEVHETVGNSHKKAGALNQVLDLLLPTLGDHAQVLVMDSDCTLDPEFLAVARANLREGSLGGVGGTFRGGPGGGLVGTFQRNEYARYERDVRRLRGRALVLTGTASVFPVSVLREVVAARRDGRLPRQLRRRVGLRPARPHRGQRALPGPAPPRLRHPRARRVHPRDRGDADLARPVGPAAALEARRDREPRATTAGPGSPCATGAVSSSASWACSPRSSTSAASWPPSGWASRSTRSGSR